MQKFKATYTPVAYIEGKCEDGEPETVMVLDIIYNDDCDMAFFVNSDNNLRFANVDRLSNCEVWD